MSGVAHPDQPVEFPRKLTTDEALHLFQTTRRRLVVELVDALGPLDIRALSDAIACITAREYKSVYISLLQRHLPTLADHNVIELGEQGHHVEPGAHFGDCAAFVADAQSRFLSDPEDKLEQIDGGEN